MTQDLNTLMVEWKNTLGCKLPLSEELRLKCLENFLDTALDQGVKPEDLSKIQVHHPHLDGTGRLDLFNSTELLSRYYYQRGASQHISEKAFENMIQIMHSKGLNIHEGESEGHGIFQYAVFYRDLKGVKLMLDFGSDPNQQVPYPQLKENHLYLGPALHRATYLGHTELMSLLVESGALVNLRNSYDKVSALHIASKLEYPSSFDYLIQAGAEINSVNASSETPLHHAIYSEIFPYVKSLIEGGAVMTICNKFGNNALDWAVQTSSPEIISYLQEINFVREEKQALEDALKRLTSVSPEGSVTELGIKKRKSI